MTGLRVASIYEGFFAGGARILHSSVLSRLHQQGRQAHSVVSIHREMLRETLPQRMQDDQCYRQLRAAGVRVSSLGRVFDGTGSAAPFNPAELSWAARRLRRADVLCSLKEQPLRLVNHPDLPARPTIVCLHRSDPHNQADALIELRRAVAQGRISAAVCCAESTRVAYRAAGVPAGLLLVIPNGVDLDRFRPVSPERRSALRRALGLPTPAAVVLFAARYDAMKNVPLLLASARRFLAARADGQVLMCGAGMGEANTELVEIARHVFADQPGLLARLRLLGLRREMEQVYAAADVVALTSTVGEAAPLCLIEGMMCGAVPVSTDVGDCAAIVAGHGLLTGWDPDEIAAAWSEAVARRPEFSPALLRSRARFSQSRMTTAYSALLDRVGRDRARGRAWVRPPAGSRPGPLVHAPPQRFA
jgi:glycosyltransferase involved in cell wall biosynthesis